MSDQILREPTGNFYNQMRADQFEWRRHNLSNQDPGKQNGGYHDHVSPAKLWEFNLWSGIDSKSQHSLPDYLEEN